MKAQILKIAGVKNTKDFYRKFPNEEAFMKKHGKEFKKACGGRVKKAQDGLEMESLVNIGGNLAEGITGLINEKKRLDRANQWKKVSDITLEASQTRPEEIQRRYVRPEDNITIGEQLYPIYGTGTEVLGKSGIHIKPSKRGTFTSAAKKHGKGVQEFASQVLGNKDNYSPAMVKKANFARNASKWKKADWGEFITKFDEAGLTDKLSGVLGDITGENAGGNLGGGIGEAAGMLVPIPGASVVGKIAGQAIGSLIDRKPQKIKAATDAMNRNINAMTINNNLRERQGVNSSFMRTGGKIRQNNMNDLDVYEGDAKTISYNPFLPDEGETVMFRGPSHKDGGMDISYGNTPVEVEGGEPAVKLENGGGEEDLVVFGNLPINKELIPLLGDKDAKGKKFKNYVADLSKKEGKINKVMEKSLKELDDLEVNTPYDKLKFSSHKANILGSQMKLKDIADKKERAASLQKAINDVAEENDTAPEKVAKTKAFDGAGIARMATGMLNDYNKAKEEDTFDWLNSVSGVIPYLRPSDAENLNPRQLAGEMYALSTNQLEPVQAQTFQPELSSPYDVSLQEIMNENQADYRNATRMVQNNPAMLAKLNADKYKANQKVKAEEFRANQTLKDKTYSENRALFNNAKLKNLEILDNQYVRQAQAKSNTKGVNQAALSSIASKYLQNELENRKLRTYENMYNYRYDDQGRLINMNAPARFNTDVGMTANRRTVPYPAPEGKRWVYDEYGQPVDLKPIPKSESRNGSVIKMSKY